MKARGGAISPHRGKKDGPLSPVQHDVLKCLADGLTYEEARQALGYSNVGSIRDHVALSVAKLELNTSQELVGVYAQYMLLRRLEGEMYSRAERLRLAGGDDKLTSSMAWHLESIATEYRYEAFRIIPAHNTPECVHGRHISMVSCQACKMNRTKEHTFRPVTVKDPYSKISTQYCTYCSDRQRGGAHRLEPTSAPVSRRDQVAVDRTPVELPEGVRHGSRRAYQKHKCRCIPCSHAQSRYKADLRAREKERRAVDALVA